MAVVIRNTNSNCMERFYLFEILRGLFLTLRHFVWNLTHLKRMPTLDYPETKRTLHPNFRARHRLLKDLKSGRMLCTACMLCATACPSRCITIEGAEHPDPEIEKYPAIYRIDLTRCIFCGLCVEACPMQAIDMNSGLYELAGSDRKKFTLKRDDLLVD